MSESEWGNSPITIIGAGFSGVALATHLLERCQPVRLIGPAADFGRGLAYGPARPEHLLNVPADRMGLKTDAVAEFADWLNLEGEARRSFVPRRWYGDYLLQQIDALRAGYPEHFETLAVAASSLRCNDDGSWHVTLRDGRHVESRNLVLAIGTAPLPTASSDAGDARIDPWAEGALDAIRDDDPVLIVGSGLTMIDAAGSLLMRGHRGGITAISRRGLLPRIHPEPPQPPVTLPPALIAALDAGNLVAALRQFRRAVDAGVSPDALADSLRARLPAVWRGFNPRTRRQFLRHLRRWWDRVRHRVPAEPLQRLHTAADAGRFRLMAARLLAHDRAVARLLQRGATTPIDIPACWIIDASGWDGDAGRFARHPLLSRLLDAGTALLDAQGLGLRCDAEGRVMGRNGVTDGLYLMGSLRRGECWESNAVPELRVQAAQMAQTLAPA